MVFWQVYFRLGWFQIKYVIDPELAAICNFIVNNSIEKLTPYFWEMPENFRVPAIFFPVPETTNEKVTFNMIKTHLTWWIRFYAADDLQAYGIASYIQTKILLERNKIPLYSEDGRLMSKPLNIGFPFLKKVGEGIQQMEISCDQYKGLPVPNGPKVVEFNYIGLDYSESSENQDIYQKAINEEEDRHETGRKSG